MTGWPAIRGLTAARIGLARSGASLGTAPLLDFRLAHAQARDAVHAPLDEAALVALLPGPVVVVSSQAADRRTYLMRPDLWGGGLTRRAAASALAPHAGAHDLVIVLGDGLSALALQRHAGPLLDLAVAGAGGLGAGAAGAGAGRAGDGGGWRGAGSWAPLSVLILIGERPGLSAPDSLGAYLTWGPGPSTTDADRNCISNIRPGRARICGGGAPAASSAGTDAGGADVRGRAEG